MADKRFAVIDLLKTFAIVGVILIHVSAAAIAMPMGTDAWCSGLVWGAVGWFGVQCAGGVYRCF